MGSIELRDVAKIYPFVETGGLLGRRQRIEQLARQKAMPYVTNEGVIVLQHIDLTIRDGEFLVLLGPSGCGKTTLLRLLSGLETPTVGSVLFDGKDMAGVPPEDRDVAMVFQNYSLYPHFTVFDNIAFPLRNLHIPRQELTETVERMAALLDLSDCLNRLPFQLSGGQVQRVAIARALVRKPRLFLMDEPFSNLDAPMRAALRRMVKRIHTELGTTFVYVTHDQTEALALGERILIMKDGCVLQDGTPAQIYTGPNCVDAALALGTPPMNLFPDLPSEDGFVTLLGVRVPLPEGVNGPVSVGIRPVHIQPAADGTPVRIETVEELGSERVLHLSAEGRTFLAVIPTEPGKTFLRGDRISVTFDPARVCLFDGDGAALFH